MFRGCDNVNACWDEAACCDRWGEDVNIKLIIFIDIRNDVEGYGNLRVWNVKW